MSSERARFFIPILIGTLVSACGDTSVTTDIHTPSERASVKKSLERSLRSYGVGVKCAMVNEVPPAGSLLGKVIASSTDIRITAEKIEGKEREVCVARTVDDWLAVCECSDTRAKEGV